MSPSKTPRRLSALVLVLSVSGFAAAACGVAITSAGTSTATPGATLAHAPANTGGTGPVRCELVLDEARGSTTIQGRVTTERPVSGTYRLSIASRSAGGSATINQSGDFDARPGAPALLGQTTLGGARGNHRADLEVRVDGRRVTCTDARGAREL
jgi:hypothetical protein